MQLNVMGTPINAAANGKHLDIVEALLAAHADVNSVFPSVSESCNMKCESCNRRRCVKGMPVTPSEVHMGSMNHATLSVNEWMHAPSEVHVGMKSQLHSLAGGVWICIV